MTDFAPVPATRHVAQQQMNRPHGWWAMLRAWVLGVRR